MKGTWWGSEWFAGLVIVAGFALTLRFDPLAGSEGWMYDLAVDLTAPATIDEGITIVTTDGAQPHSGGEHWPRELVSHLLTRLNQASPRTVVLYWPGDSASVSDDLSDLAREAGRLLKQQPRNDVAPLLQKIALYAGSDQQISAAMRSVNQLILAAMPKVSWSHHWQGSLQELIAPLSPLLAEVTKPEPLFSTAAYRVADDTAMSETSGVVRRVPLLYRASNDALSPTLPLQLWMLRQQLDPDSLRLTEAGSLEVNGRRIAMDSGGYFHPRWSQGSVQTVSLSELLTNDDDIYRDRLRDRIVLVGPTTPALTSMTTLPDGRLVAPVEMAALTLTALMAQDSIDIPPYARWAQLGALLIVALVLTLLLPRLSTPVALVTGMVLLIALLNTQLLLFLLRGEWLPLTTPTLALATGVAWSSVRRRAMRAHHHLREQLGRVTVALAQQLRHQGQFDEALFHLQQCPVGAACDELYQLGLDYERKRQFNKAEQVFDYLRQEKPRFKDVAERARSNREARERIVIAGHPSSNMVSTMVMDQSALQKPVVGRYQIERELGRGAMGMVYLGHDPKISRTVAIKTVSLAHEYDDKLEQVRERFFREAESAGRLSHPHIVTIYDVGEEGDLAYIAMDYLPGVSLDHHTAKDALLPVEEVMAIIMQVADALDYAHDKGVIHRDIKPANIIYDRERGEATVTDFGVAHLADASKTRTGTILGSPYYMAPEQLAGAKVDGRADLFSLGVTFYQLLTGAMPFEADSITTLMYKIANSRHASVSKLRRGVPACASRIVNQLLQKEAEKRYQRGEELHKALQRCLK